MKKMPTLNRRSKKGRARPEFGLVSILEKQLSELRPAAINNQLYRPVSPSDPEIVALAKSIRKHGLHEPLIITLDNVILSGHRRRVACMVAGLTVVPCRVMNIRSTDPGFAARLRECNRQRIKSIVEIAREEILSADPEESYRALREYRQEQARIDVDTIQIAGVKTRPEISSAKMPMLIAIMNILDANQVFWPLTDRQIHYLLLNNPPLVHAKKPHSRYRNTIQCYKATCELLTRARLDARIPFKAIQDPTRPMEVWRIHRDPTSFLRKEFNGFLKGYYRDLQQSQPNHIELIAEKLTLASIIRPVAAEYGIPMTIGRGYCSLPPRYEMEQRFRRSGREKLIILAIGDFDPEGEDIAHSFVRSMRDDFGVEDVEAVKVALTSEQVQELRLPPKMKAKKTSSRYDNFVEEHGEDVFEIEAVPPDQLQSILRQSIDSVLDIKAFNKEIAAEKRDAARLDSIRKALKGNLAAMLPAGEADE
jgi:hypothetical protein